MWLLLDRSLIERHFIKSGFHTPSCWGYRFFFEVDPPGFLVEFTVILLEFSIFLHWPPGNPCFFLNSWFTPLEFQLLELYPLEFSIDILKKPNVLWLCKYTSGYTIVNSESGMVKYYDILQWFCLSSYNIFLLRCKQCVLFFKFLNKIKIISLEV